LKSVGVEMEGRCGYGHAECLFDLTISTIGCQAGQEDGSQCSLPLFAAAFGRDLGAEAQRSCVGQRGSNSGASEAG